MRACGNEAKARRHRARDAERRRVTSRYRWVILGVGAAGAGAFSALRMGLPALGPALRDAYGLSLREVGFAFAALAIGVMLTLVPWGMLTDRIGERPVLARRPGRCRRRARRRPPYAPSYPCLLAGLLVAGMLGASATGASGRAVMGWFARHERGFALGIRQMALPLGGAVALGRAAAAGGAGGLQAAFLALGGLVPRRGDRGGAVHARRAAAPPGRSVDRRAAPPTARPAPLAARRRRAALLVAAQAAMLGFVVLFLHDERGVSAAALAGGAARGAAARAARSGAHRRRAPVGPRGPRIVPMRRTRVARRALLAATAGARPRRPARCSTRS